MRKYIMRFSILVMLCVFCVQPYVSAEISPEQRNLIRKGIYYYNLDPCSGVGASTPEKVSAGKGEPEGAVFPNLDAAAMASAIDKYIAETNSQSKLGDLGETIVAGAKNSNVSPFLIVAIAQKESGLASPSDYNVRNGNNAFGRTATASQPNFQGARLWYKWSSVKASVNHQAQENKNARGGGDIAAYIRNQYSADIDDGDIQSFFKKYAPEFENDTAKYIKDVGNGIKKMVTMTGATTATPDVEPTVEDVADSGESGECGCSIGGGDSGLRGSENGAKIFNFYVDKGLTAEQAAAFAGNFFQESGWDPTAINGSSGATGLVQWLGGRLTALQSYAREKNKPVTSLSLQLDFSWKELQGSEAAALQAVKAIGGSGPEAVEQATVAVRVRYERPGAAEANDPRRIEKAMEVYNANKDSAGGPRSDSSTDECGNSTPEGSGESTGQFIWPIDKAIGPVTSCYGYARGRLHTGVDIGAASGTTVKAADGGTVDQVGNTDPNGFGNTVVIKHDNGKWTLYAHLRKISVRKGQKVDQGQEVGKSGGGAGDPGRGSSTGAHLHFNIQNQGGQGQGSEDPLKHLPNDGRPKSGGDC